MLFIVYLQKKDKRSSMNNFSSDEKQIVKNIINHNKTIVHIYLSIYMCVLTQQKTLSSYKIKMVTGVEILFIYSKILKNSCKHFIIKCILF